MPCNIFPTLLQHILIERYCSWILNTYDLILNLFIKLKKYSKKESNKFIRLVFPDQKIHQFIELKNKAIK